MLTCWLLSVAFGHDYVLEGTLEGRQVRISGVVAHETAREARTERPETLTRLDRVVEGASRRVRPRGPGWGTVRTSSDRVTAVVYQNSGAVVELAWERFRSYVAKEGDPRVLPTVDALPRTPQREHYRRSLKLLIGEASSMGWDQVVGLPLELVPEGSGPPRRVRLLAEGEPVVGAVVRAFPFDGHTEDDAVRATTDDTGTATLALPAGGQDWVVAAVIMDHDPERETPWSSTWTTLRRLVAGADPG